MSTKYFSKLFKSLIDFIEWFDINKKSNKNLNIAANKAINVNKK